MTVFIDTDVVIEVLRGRNRAFTENWQRLAASQVAILISPITIAEVGAGARPREKDVIARLFAPLICVPIDALIGHRAGEYLLRYARSHNVEIGDALIAASAVQNQAALWTRNEKHYPMPELTMHVGEVNEMSGLRRG
ncbi:MAG: type II toxin-antitoxin system VapC family toxin [Terracidiphilus sp.]